MREGVLSLRRQYTVIHTFLGIPESVCLFPSHASARAHFNRLLAECPSDWENGYGAPVSAEDDYATDGATEYRIMEAH